MDAIIASFSRLDRLKIRLRVNLYLEMQSRPSEHVLGQSQDPRLWLFYLAIFGIEKPENDGYNPQIQKLCSHMTLGRWVGLLCQADRRQETRDDSPSFPENWDYNQNCSLSYPTNKISFPKQACLPGTGLDGQVLHPDSAAVTP